MSVIELSKKNIKKLVGKEISDKEFEDRVPMMGTPVEGMEGDALIVEINPNRPDLLSEQGFARYFASFLGTKPGLREYKAEKSGEKLIVEKSVEKVRPFTACAIVKNLEFDDQKIKDIIQVQEKLHITFGRNRKKAAIGIYPMEAIKFPIRYLAKKPKEIIFRPLESPKEMDALKILSQHPCGRDFAHLLEGAEVFPIFIDADDKILSMPPITNSHDTGKITVDTKDVFIECSGSDFRALKECMNMIVTALGDMGGKIYSMELEYPDKKYTSPELDSWEMEFDPAYISRLLGVDLDDKKLEECLGKMGLGFLKGKSKELPKALIPPYRTDIMHQVDIAEDIAIAYGYENFEEIIPEVATIGHEDGLESFKRKVSEILVGYGLLEVNTFHITNKNNQMKMMGLVEGGDSCPDLVTLANPLTVDFSVMRGWIIPDVMDTFKHNKHNEYPQNVFAVGTIFKKKDVTETKTIENDRLACGICDSEADYTKIRQIFDALMRALDTEYEILDIDHPSFIPGRVGRVNVKSKGIAYIGEIEPQVLENFEMTMPVAVFELNLTELYELIRE